MTDPKHLPPRDCLVELDAVDETGTTHVHVTYERASKTWFCKLTGDALEPERVITWTELPEAK